MATALEKAIAKQYGQKKKKKNTKKSVGGAYGELQKKQNEQKQAYAKKVAAQKNTAKKSTPLEKAISKSSNSKTTTASKKSTRTWNDVVKEQNKKRQEQAKKTAAATKTKKEERPSSKYDWKEFQAYRRKNRANETALGANKQSHTLNYGEEKKKEHRVENHYGNLNIKYTGTGSGTHKENTTQKTPGLVEREQRKEDKKQTDRIKSNAAIQKLEMYQASTAEAVKTVDKYAKERNITLSDEERDKLTKRLQKDMYNQVSKTIDRNADKQIKDKAWRTVEAETKDGKSKKFKYEDLTKDEMNALITANTAFPGNTTAQNNYLRSVGGEKLLKKIGDVNAASMFKGAAAAGFMEGASMAPVHSNLAGSYSDQAKEVMQAAKEKGSYTAGNMAGMAAQFAMGGTNALAESIVAKALPKVTSNVGKFAARRGAEILTESGMDLSDAYKQSLDENGELAKAELVKQILMNLGLNVGVGTAMDIGSKLLTRNTAKRLFELENKQALGKITPEEMNELVSVRHKLLEKADDKMSAGSDVAKRELERADTNANYKLARNMKEADLDKYNIERTENGTYKNKATGKEMSEAEATTRIRSKDNINLQKVARYEELESTKDSLIKKSDEPNVEERMAEIRNEQNMLFDTPEEYRIAKASLSDVDEQFPEDYNIARGGEDGKELTDLQRTESVVGHDAPGLETARRGGSEEGRGYEDLDSGRSGSVQSIDGEIQGQPVRANISNAINDFRRGEPTEKAVKGETVAKYDDIEDISHQPERFLKLLSANSNGLPTVTKNELKANNVKLFADADGNTLGVDSAGNIFGATTTIATDKLPDGLIFKAIENGGAKGEIVGEDAIRDFSSFGMTPVARTQMQDGTYKYFFISNRDNINDVKHKYSNNEYHMWSKDELDSIQDFSYDEALAFRDELFEQQTAALNGDESIILFKGTNIPISNEFRDFLSALEDEDLYDIPEELMERYEQIPEIKTAKQRIKRFENKHSAEDFANDPNRQETVNSIIDELSNYGSAVKTDEGTSYTGPVEKGHRADIVIGLPGAGKSSAIAEPLSYAHKSRIIDSDDAKKLLPEYDDGFGAGYVHEESTIIAEKARNNTLKSGDNIVIQTIGNNADYVEDYINECIEYGYKVYLHLCDVPPAKAAARNLRRYALDSRLVDLRDTSFKLGDAPTKAYNEIISTQKTKKGEYRLDGYEKVSNDVQPGTVPEFVEGTYDISADWENYIRSTGQGNGTNKTKVTGQSPGIQGTRVRSSSSSKEIHLENANGKHDEIRNNSSEKSTISERPPKGGSSNAKKKGSAVKAKKTGEPKKTSNQTANKKGSAVKSTGKTAPSKAKGKPATEVDVIAGEKPPKAEPKKAKEKTLGEQIADTFNEHSKEPKKFTDKEKQSFDKTGKDVIGKIRQGKESEALSVAKEFAEGINKDEAEKIAKGIVDKAKAEHKRIVEKAEADAKEKIKSMSNEQFYNTAMKNLDTPTTSAHLSTLLKTISSEVDPENRYVLLEGLEDKKGLFGKVKGVSQKDAIDKAENQLRTRGIDSLFDDYMDVDVAPTGVVGQDIHIVQAKGSVLLNELVKQLNAGEGDTDKLVNQIYKVFGKSTEIESTAGRALNASKMMLRETPAGRVSTVLKEKDRLYQRFKDRIKGDELHISEDKLQRLSQDLSDEELDKLLDEINVELWEQIPSTFMERFNEWRHFSMLANFRTHGRNVVGNGVFKAARTMADGIEMGILTALGKNSKWKATMDEWARAEGKKEFKAVAATHVTQEEISAAKKAIHEHYDKLYAESESTSQFIERNRPTNVGVHKNKGFGKILNKLYAGNYKLLDMEDNLLFMRPEYTRQFVKYCKTYGLDFNNIDNIPKQSLKKADEFAFQKAQVTSYRDACYISEVITKKKQQLAGIKTDSFFLDTAARLGGVVLESIIPFVKTPINLFRRAIDYSPISLVRAAAKLSKAAKRGNTDLVLEGIHHLATGLTGTSVFALGMWLYNQDIVNIKAGQVSGNAYYDRDMGYQDYSLTIGGKSISIDWLAPMQNSLFMGATIMQKFQEDGFSFREACEGLAAMGNPMLEMSFMASAKDTIEMFMETADSGENNPDYLGAVMSTVCGNLPQGWLGSFMPQIISQTANVLDPYQRDTRSTREDVIEKSWDRFIKQQINKVPVLRQTVLNPKLDRFGNDVENGSNVATRILQYMFNPATVKNINFTKTDKELIKIYNSLEDGSYDKKNFFYMFTGNPSYDLHGEDGKRMTYDEAYKYGKENRSQQAKHIEEMFNAASYKDMTNEQKVKELDGYNEIATAQADMKVYGAKYALEKNVLSPFKPAAVKAWEVYKHYSGNEKDFMNDWVKIEKFLNRCGTSTSDYRAMAAILTKLPDTDRISKAYSVYGEKLDDAKTYYKRGGSLKEYSDAACRIGAGIAKASATVNKANQSRAAADYPINKRTYLAMGYDWNSAQAGAGLKKYGYDFSKCANDKTKHNLEWLKMEAEKAGDKDHNGRLNKKELIAFIDSMEDVKSDDERACLFEYLSASNSKNPYKVKINDHLKWGKYTEESTGSSSGSGRRYYGGRSGGRSGGSGSGSGSGTTGDWRKFLDDKRVDIPKYATSSSKVPTVRDGDDWKDVITTTYKNKVRKMRKEATKRRS